MPIIHDCPQYSPEYWAVRRGVPTASNASRIITPAKAVMSSQAEAYACELIAEKYDAYYGIQDEYVTAAMKNGTIMEPEARRFYEFEMNCDVQQVGFVLTDDGRFGCSPDGLVGEDGGLELKSPTTATHVRYLIKGGVPLEYLPQIHWSLIVTGRKFWSFMSYCPGLPPLLVRVEPDEFTEKLRACMEEFWALYQELDRKVAAKREEAIDAAIDAAGGPEESYF